MTTYYFHNVTCNDINLIPIFQANKFACLDDKDMIKIFQYLIMKNNWSKTDIIHAIPDYSDYHIIEYDNNNINFINR